MRIQVWGDTSRSLAQPAPHSMSYDIRPAGQGFMLLILKACKDGDCTTILGNASHQGLPPWWRCFGLHTVRTSPVSTCAHYFIPPLSPALSSLCLSYNLIAGTGTLLFGLPTALSAPGWQDLIVSCLVCVTQTCQTFTWPTLFSVPAWFDHLHCSCPAGQMFHET